MIEKLPILIIPPDERKKVIETLEKYAAEDQEFCTKYDNNVKVIYPKTKHHRKYAREIVRRYGLIDKDRFNEKTSENMWLIVQHFPSTSVGFQDKYCRLMKGAIDKINPRNYAYLTDRILANKSKPTMFGTQLYLRRGKSPQKFRSILNVKNVDMRRVQYNLEPLNEYAELFGEIGKDIVLPEGYEDTVR